MYSDIKAIINDFSVQPTPDMNIINLIGSLPRKGNRVPEE